MRIDPDVVTPEELVAHGAWVRALARYLVADPALADDVEQETWLSALRRPPGDARNLRAWLARVLRRRLRDQLRSEGRRRHHHEQAPPRGDVPSTAELVERAETQTAVAQAVLGLDEPYRGTVLLRFFEGLPPRRIAEHQGVPVATVHTRLQRALPRLRRILADRYGPQSRSWRAALLPIAGLAGPGDIAPPGAGSAILVSTKAKTVSFVAVVVVLLAAGLGVLLWGPGADGDGRPPTPATTSGTDGELAGASESRARLQGRGGDASAPDGSTTELPAAARAGEGLFVLRGTVVRGGRGVHARIEVRPSATGRAWSSMLRAPETEGPALLAAESDATGRFTIEGMDAGSYEVAAYGEDGGCGSARVMLGPPLAVDMRATIQLSAGGAVVAGRARWSDGRPFRGWVRVWSGRWFTGGAWSRAIETDSEGRFRLDGLEEGESGVAFLRHDAMLSIFWGVEVPWKKEREFVLDDGLVPYRGRVVADDDEEPLADVEIHVRGGGRLGRRGSKPEPREVLGLGRSDEAGAFAFESGGPSAKFWFFREGFAPVQTALETGSELLVRMKRRGRVKGRVVAKDAGRPVVGVPIHTWSWGQHYGGEQQMISDEEGHFAGPVGPGKGMVFAFGGGWVSEFLPEMTTFGLMPGQITADQGQIADATLLVIPTASVAGIVRRPDGRPAAGAVVRLDHPRGWRGYSQAFHHPDTIVTSAGDDGRFRFADLIPGFPYEIRARLAGAPQGRSETLSAQSGETHRVEIALPQAGWLTVRVVAKKTQRPVPGALVQGHQEGQYFPPEAQTDAQGLARFGPLAPGPVWIGVEREGYLRAPQHTGGFGAPPTLAVPVPTPPKFVVELEQALWVGGTVTFEDGTTIPDAGVQLEHPGREQPSGFGLRGRARVREDGSFWSGPVPAGAYDLVVVSGKEVLDRWPVEAGGRHYAFKVAAPTDAPPEDSFVVRLRGPDGREARAGVFVVHREEGHIFHHEPEIRGLEAGEVVRIEVRSPRDADGKPLGGFLSEPVVVGGDAVEIVLPFETHIAGRILAPDGEGVDGLRLSAMPLHPGLPQGRPLGMLPATRTDATGSFRLGQLPAVSHRLLLELPQAYAASRPPEVAASDTGVEIRLTTASTVRVRVQTADGKPARGAWLRASLPAYPGLVRTAEVDAHGEATLPGLDPDVVYRLRIDPPPGRTDVAPLVREGWLPRAETLELEDAGTGGG